MFVEGATPTCTNFGKNQVWPMTNFGQTKFGQIFGPFHSGNFGFLQGVGWGGGREGGRVRGRGPKPAGGFTRQPESQNVHIWGPGIQKTPPQFHEKTPQEREERIENSGGRGKKERNFGPPPPFGCLHPSGHHPSDAHPSGPHTSGTHNSGPHPLPTRWPKSVLA